MTNTPHRATPEQWQQVEADACHWPGAGIHCLLELRDRLAAAEQRISELEGKQDTQRVAMLDVYQHLEKLKTQHESNWSRIVKLEEAADHLQDAPKMVPAESLVEVVADAIHDEAGSCCAPVEARAAILAVADWLRKKGGYPDAWMAQMLEKEVERHG